MICFYFIYLSHYLDQNVGNVETCNFKAASTALTYIHSILNKQFAELCNVYVQELPNIDIKELRFNKVTLLI